MHAYAHVCARVCVYVCMCVRCVCVFTKLCFVLADSSDAARVRSSILKSQQFSHIL